MLNDKLLYGRDEFWYVQQSYSSPLLLIEKMKRKNMIVLVGAYIALLTMISYESIRFRSSGALIFVSFGSCQLWHTTAFININGLCIIAFFMCARPHEHRGSEMAKKNWKSQLSEIFSLSLSFSIPTYRSLLPWHILNTIHAHSYQNRTIYTYQTGKLKIFC